MIKFIFAVRRQEGMTRDDFQRHWRDHASLWVRNSEALQIRRYVQTHALETAMDEGMAAARGSKPRYYDGTEELWFDSIDALIAAFSTDAGKAAAVELRDHETKFIDLPHSPMWLGEEHAIIGS